MSQNANIESLAKHYSQLMPEERFRLILAAGNRHDEPERERLVRSSGRLVLSFADHAPFHAFGELAHWMYIELLDEIARYEAALAFDHTVASADAIDEERDETDDSESSEAGTTRRPLWQQSLDLVLASGLRAADKDRQLDPVLQRVEHSALPPVGVLRRP